MCAAPKGNNYWQFRDKHGRDYKYQPDELWDEFVQYSEGVEKNPLHEQKVFSFQGMISTHEMPKMRAMTVIGFCLFADISYETFRQYKQNKDFIAVSTRIEDSIYQQKFEGASADLLNPNIIARDLGLADKRDLSSTDGSMSPKAPVSLDDWYNPKRGE